MSELNMSKMSPTGEKVKIIPEIYELRQKLLNSRSNGKIILGEMENFVEKF